MIISEKQIMQLMTYTLGLLSRLSQEGSAIDTRNEIGSLIEQINDQQSEELKVIE